MEDTLKYDNSNKHEERSQSGGGSGSGGGRARQINSHRSSSNQPLKSHCEKFSNCRNRSSLYGVVGGSSYVRNLNKEFDEGI